MRIILSLEIKWFIYLSHLEKMKYHYFTREDSQIDHYFLFLLFSCFWTSIKKFIQLYKITAGSFCFDESQVVLFSSRFYMFVSSSILHCLWSDVARGLLLCINLGHDNYSSAEHWGERKVTSVQSSQELKIALFTHNSVDIVLNKLNKVQKHVCDVKHNQCKLMVKCTFQIWNLICFDLLMNGNLYQIRLQFIEFYLKFLIWCISDAIWGNPSELKHVTRTFSVFYLIEVLISRCTFCWKPKLDHWFQSYEQLKDSQNNRKQKKCIPFSGSISQSMLPTSNCFP